MQSSNDAASELRLTLLALTLLISGGISAAIGAAVTAADEVKVWIPAGAASAAKEQTNKQTVVGGWLQDPGKAHWRNFMVPEFINHDPDEPRVGAQSLVDLMNSGRSASTLAAVIPPGGKARPRFFVIADGDYVAVAHNPAGFDLDRPAAGVDPGANVGGNVFHVVDGKITEWWYYANGGGGGGGGGARGGESTVKQPGAEVIDVAKGSIRPAIFGNTPIAYGPGALSDKVEAANKTLVLNWLREFWVNQNYDSWSKYMNANFRNHDARMPAVGATALAQWLRANPAFQSDYATAKGVAHPQLFLLAEGDLVFVLASAEVNQSFDPQAQLGRMSGNVIRVSDGKIVEWWRAGNSAPRNPPAGGRGG